MIHTKQQLTPARQHLLKTLQTLNFGQIRQLHLKAGEPVFQPPPLVVKDWKLDGDNDARPGSHLQNFALKTHYLKLFEVFDTISDGIVDEIHCRYGLPCKVVTTRAAC